MKQKISLYFVLTVVLAALIIILLLTDKTGDRCDSVKTALTSVVVKHSNGLQFIGFDLNKHNLTFGTLSPGATSRRVITSQYTKNATAYVWVEGNFSSWVAISPRQFGNVANVPQEVAFTVLVPLNAKEGEHNGRVVFCYQDKKLGWRSFNLSQLPNYRNFYK